MDPQQFIYVPDLAADEFRCRVLLPDNRQQYIVNGRVRGGETPFLLDLKDGEKMDKSLQIIGVRNAECTGELSFDETFRFGRNSSGRIIICSHTITPDEFSTVENVRIELSEGASVEFFVMQNEHNKARHDMRCSISLAEGASLRMVFISLHGGEINNDISVDLCGRHADCDLSGLYLADTGQKMSNSVNLRHLVPDCHSNQLFKGILNDDAVSKFYGGILVAPDAQHTEAFQANHNLLLSDLSKAYSKPQLEIYADDVKCSHGATVGRLDEDELFYMRTRGITADEARLLQQMAFAYEVLERITSDELRERVLSLVEGRLRGDFASCKGCTKNCC